jgi:hypothetical protein
MTPNSNLVTWQVIEIWDTEVPDEILKALVAEQGRQEGSSIYSLMWGDSFVLHGEDGWCASDATLAVAEDWLEVHRKAHNLDERSAFWFRVKKS